MDLSKIESLLDRIANSLETLSTKPYPASGGGGGGGGGGQTAACKKLPDGRYKWEILPEHKRAKCKYCDAEVYWFKASTSGNWCIVNPDGFGHRDTCGKAGNPVKAKPDVSSEVPF